MGKAIRNKAAGMALFATMMAVGTLPLAAKAPDGFFLESTETETTAAEQNAQMDVSRTALAVRSSSTGFTVTINGKDYKSE